MSTLRATLVEFPGSFGLAEAEVFCQRLGITTNRVWFDSEKLPATDMVVLSSGAAFADYIRPGALASRTKIAGAIKAYARAGGKVLGIANGFQILCEIGLLPGVMLQNKGAKFRNVSTYIRYEGKDNFFFKNVEAETFFSVPFVCKFGAYYADKRTIQDIEEQKLVLFRYVDQFATVDEENPFAGSLASIAALKNDTGNVVGIMPRIDRLDAQALKIVFKHLQSN